jgi:endoribonuclease Dicer
MGWTGDVEVQDDSWSGDDASGSETEAEALRDVKKPAATDDDADSDSDADDGPAQVANPISAKRRAQDEIMKAFAANVINHVTQKEVREATAKGANEGQLSIRDILASQETTVRITNPRDYQTELFQRARTENTIAVLDTGSGKTHIATLLLRHVLDEELENRAKGCVPKTAFFLV